jgi:hypothetical protein
MSLDKLKQIREEMFEICQHNFNYFKIYYKEKYGDIDESATIREVLLKLWDSLKIKKLI